jgi:hypothetical protein
VSTYNPDRTAQHLRHEAELHQTRMQFSREKAAVRLQHAREKAAAQIGLESELADIEAEADAEAEAVHGDVAIPMSTGGAATFDLLERERAAPAPPPAADPEAINQLTRAITELVRLQLAPRTIVRDSEGRPCGVRIEQPGESIPESLVGRDARAR